MLKEKDYIFSRLNMLIDIGAAACAFLAAHVLRNSLFSPYIAPTLMAPSRLSHYARFMPVFAIAAVIILAANGYYNSQRIRNASHIVKMLAAASLETMAVCISLVYMIYKKDVISRGQMVLAPALLFIFLCIKTAAVKKVLMGLRRRGYNYREILLVGSGARLEEFLRMIESHPFWGFRVKGILTDAPEQWKKGGCIHQAEIVGEARETIECVEKNPVDEVIFFPEQMSLSDAERILEGCETIVLRTRVAANFFKRRVASVELDYFESVTFVTFSPTRRMDAALFAKYAFDRIAALLFLIIFSPLFMLIILIIKLTSGKGDPIFYRQVRSGLNGKPFILFKFRSMRVGAERELESLRSKSDVTGPVFKMKSDPRVTPIGRILRKLSLDELPQFYNVLKGEMSLVGPRPPIPAEVEKYDRWQRRRLSMKPGITCLWQVMGRNKIDFDTWMKLDLQYIDNWSLWLDCTILIRTIFVVLLGYGAS